jgi:hypothetical protein
MLGGIMYNAGYFMGSSLIPLRETNPKGFYEDGLINLINEEILSVYKSSGNNPADGQRWLSAIPADVVINNITPSIEKNINDAIRQVPFCYKDPRFCYTLPVWLKYVDDDTIFLCIFRSPEITIKSILKECSVVDYLADLYIDEEIAYDIWIKIHTRILTYQKELKQRLIFVHYNQVCDGSIISMLSSTLDAKISNDFVEKNLSRIKSTGDVIPAEAVEIYNTLCELAHYNDRLLMQKEQNTENIIKLKDEKLRLKNEMIKQRTRLLRQKNIESEKYIELEKYIQSLDKIFPPNSIRRKIFVFLYRIIKKYI